MPFHLTFAGLDGQDAIQSTDVKTNVPIDESNFAKHAQTQTKNRLQGWWSMGASAPHSRLDSRRVGRGLIRDSGITTA